MSVRTKALLGAEETVARVAQTGNDIAVLIELFIAGGHIDVHVGMILLHPGDALGRGDQVDQTDVMASALLEERDGGGGAAAGSLGSSTRSSRFWLSSGSLQ